MTKHPSWQSTRTIRAPPSSDGHSHWNRWFGLFRSSPLSRSQKGKRLDRSKVFPGRRLPRTSPAALPSTPDSASSVAPAPSFPSPPAPSDPTLHVLHPRLPPPRGHLRLTPNPKTLTIPPVSHLDPALASSTPSMEDSDAPTEDNDIPIPLVLSKNCFPILPLPAFEINGLVAPASIAIKVFWRVCRCSYRWSWNSTRRRCEER